MKKLDTIKMLLDNAVLEYLDGIRPNDTFIVEETTLDFEGDVEYEANVRITAKFNFVSDYITDEYGNRNDESTYELVNHQFEIIDLIDLKNDCYLIEGKKMSEEIKEAA